jgi:hypothetical protein
MRETLVRFAAVRPKMILKFMREFRQAHVIPVETSGPLVEYFRQLAGLRSILRECRQASRNERPSQGRFLPERGTRFDAT